MTTTPTPTKQDSPYNIPEAEQYPKKSVTIRNNTEHDITFGQLQSDWQSVNFIIEDRTTWKLHKIPSKQVRVLADLLPGDTLEINFLGVKEIEQ
jgi:hypothetical protein